MTKLFEISVTPTSVILIDDRIEKPSLIDRPTYVSVSEWLDFWEAVKQLPELDVK